MLKLLSCLAAFTLAAPASAQSFDVNLGGKALGTLGFGEKGKTATLRTTLNSTPMGVFNGTFTGTSIGTATSSEFTSESQSSRKQRRVTVQIANGRAASVAITPQDELTELSDTARVPAGVTDPVRIFGALMNARGCPAAIRMYDGRRVVALAPDGQSSEGGTLICNMSYRVTAGPGHLSPLGISSAKLALRYGTSGNAQTLQQVQISSGVFRVRLDRKN